MVFDPLFILFCSISPILLFSSSFGSPAFAACGVRGNKGKAREEDPLLPPQPFVARQNAATKPPGCARSTPPPLMSTTDFAGPSRAQQYFSGLSSQSTTASDERTNIAGPRHMLPDMEHDNSSKRRIKWDLWYNTAFWVYYAGKRQPRFLPICL